MMYKTLMIMLLLLNIHSTFSYNNKPHMKEIEGSSDTVKNPFGDFVTPLNLNESNYEFIENFDNFSSAGRLYKSQNNKSDPTPKPVLTLEFAKVGDNCSMHVFKKYRGFYFEGLRAQDKSLIEKGRLQYVEFMNELKKRLKGPLYEAQNLIKDTCYNNMSWFMECQKDTKCHCVSIESIQTVKSDGLCKATSGSDCNKSIGIYCKEGECSDLFKCSSAVKLDNFMNFFLHFVIILIYFKVIKSSIKF